MNRLIDIIREWSVRAQEDPQDVMEKLQSLNKDPSSFIGNDFLWEKESPRHLYTTAQLDLIDHYIHVDSDMMNHVIHYSDEECALVKKTLSFIQELSGPQLHDDDYMTTFMREKFPHIYIDHIRKTGCVWDPRKRDTQMQFRFRLSHPMPKRLLCVPLTEVKDSLKPILRHVGKSFQSLHLTSQDKDLLVKYQDLCDTFVMSVWVGPSSDKITETGTGFRSSDFIGSGVAMDYDLRILFHSGLQGSPLQSALNDFVALFSDPSSNIPVLLNT